VKSTARFAFSPDGTWCTAPDIIIARDAANTLALRNSTNAQTFNIYNTYTDASNYERLAIKWSGNLPTITNENAGTGSARNLTVNSSNTLTLSGVSVTISPSGGIIVLQGAIVGTGYIRLAAPTIKTTSTYTAVDSDCSLIFNVSGTCTVTLPAPASYPGRWLNLKTIAAQTVVSASSNVKPIDTDTAGTAILAATAGKWAKLQSDGTNWVIMESN
jgi:hypothetical protein